MKTLKILAFTILIIFIVSCSVGKHVNKSSYTELKQTVTDSLATHSSQQSEKTQQSDSSVITTTEHIETAYQVPDSGKTILVSQKIDRKIVEKKAIKIQVDKAAVEKSNTDLQKKESDNQSKKEVTKEITKNRIPWWVYLTIILFAAVLVFIYKDSLLKIIRKIGFLFFK